MDDANSLKGMRVFQKLRRKATAQFPRVAFLQPQIYLTGPVHMVIWSLCLLL